MTIRPDTTSIAIGFLPEAVRGGRKNQVPIVFSIKPGIPPEWREQVFEMGKTTSEEGTGLGLSIADTIAKAHGWSLSVGQGPEGGARFEITGVDVEEPTVEDSLKG